MPNFVEKLVDTLAYSAGNDVQVDLPQDGMITRIDIGFDITNSGAGASALSVAGLWRVIQNLTITGGSGKSYYSLVGTQMGILQHYLNLIDFPGKTWREIVATTQECKLRLHFGSRPRDIWGRDNPFDLTAAIPAMDETNLKLTWGCAASDDTVDDTLTISSGTAYVTVYKVQPARGRYPRGWSGMIPVSSSESYDPGATKSALEGQRDIPTGAYVRRIAIMALDATAGSSNGPLLKDDQLTEVGIKLVKENRWLVQVLTKSIELGNPLLDGMQVVDTPNTQSPHNPTGGLYQLDLRQHGNPDYGLDTAGYEPPFKPMTTGDLKLGMTIGAYASAEKEHIFYDQVQKYQKRPG